MTQTQNISLRNALVRITMGLSMIAYGTSHLMKEPSSNRGRMMIVLGAMKTGEGTLRYCPTKALLNTSIKNIMSESGALGNTGNSPMQNMGSAMQNVGSTVQNMMGGAGTGTSGGAGTGLQNVVPEVTKLMKDFAGIGNAGGNTTNNNQSGNTGGNNQSNTTATSSVFGSTGGNATQNNTTNGNKQSGNVSNTSTSKTANNNASGDPNKNNSGNKTNNGTNGNKNGSAPINPS